MKTIWRLCLFQSCSFPLAIERLSPACPEAAVQPKATLRPFSGQGIELRRQAGQPPAAWGRAWGQKENNPVTQCIPAASAASALHSGQLLKCFLPLFNSSVITPGLSPPPADTLIPPARGGASSTLFSGGEGRQHKPWKSCLAYSACCAPASLLASDSDLHPGKGDDSNASGTLKPKRLCMGLV